MVERTDETDIVTIHGFLELPEQFEKYPGGIKAISRWLSGSDTTGFVLLNAPHPGGMPAELGRDWNVCAT